MHYAEQNSYYINQVLQLFKAKGYQTTGSWFDYGISVSSLGGSYALAEKEAETRKSWQVPYHLLAQPDDDEGERRNKFTAFLVWYGDFSQTIPDSSFTMRNLVLEMLDKIRVIMPEVDLPPGFINPIEELAEALRSNILEGPKAPNAETAAALLDSRSGVVTRAESVNDLF